MRADGAVTREVARAALEVYDVDESGLDRLARAVLPVAAVFLGWDAIAIGARVWTFNPRYVTGIRPLFGVPLEEVVFFLVVPVCALLVHGCVEVLLRRVRRGRRPSAGRSR